MLGVGHCALCLWIDVEQTFHLMAIDNVLLDNLRRIAGFYLHIKGVVGDNLDNRTLLTESETAGSDHFGLVLQACFLNRCLEILHDLCTL